MNGGLAKMDRDTKMNDWHVLHIPFAVDSMYSFWFSCYFDFVSERNGQHENGNIYSMLVSERCHIVSFHAFVYRPISKCYSLMHS